MLSTRVTSVVMAVPGPAIAGGALTATFALIVVEVLIVDCPVAGSPSPPDAPPPSLMAALEGTGGAFLKDRAGVLASSIRIIIQIPTFPFGPSKGVQ